MHTRPAWGVNYATTSTENALNMRPLSLENARLTRVVRQKCIPIRQKMHGTCDTIRQCMPSVLPPTMGKCMGNVPRLLDINAKSADPRSECYNKCGGEVYLSPTPLRLGVRSDMSQNAREHSCDLAKATFYSAGEGRSSRAAQFHPEGRYGGAKNATPSTESGSKMQPLQQKMHT